MQQPNLLIKPEDIRANPELWVQKISIIEFKDSNNKPYWTKEYPFLPHWKRWKEATEWIKNTNFPEYNCKIIKNENNEITLYTQNFFGKKISQEQKEKDLLGKIRLKLRKMNKTVSPAKLAQWKNINPNFNERMIREWEKESFAYEEAKEWIDIGLTGNDASFCGWLRDKGLTTEEVLNYGNIEELREEFELSELETEPEYDLEEALKFTNYEEFSNWEHSYLINEELDQWTEIRGDEEKDQPKAYDLSRNDIAILWKKKLYWISNFAYINNYKLTVEIKAKVCPVFVRYPKWLSGAGRGVVEQGNLIKLTSEKLEDNQRMHYPFCGELGIKKIDQQAFGSYQPRFQLFRGKLVTDWATGRRNISWGGSQGLQLPTDVYLEKFTGDAFDWMDNYQALRALLTLGAITGAERPIRAAAESIFNSKLMLTIGPQEMEPNGPKGSFFDSFQEYEEILFPNNPTFTKWLKEQPHLWDHTTFQFYLFDKITMTANGRYLGIKERDGKFILPYKLFINYAPGALYYRWQFEFIYVKLEISNTESFDDWTHPMKLLGGFNFKIEGGVLGSGGGFGLGLNWNEANLKDAGQAKQNKDPSPEQEAHTERMFKSTFKDALDKSVEPAMFNANTIDFHYSFGEFLNRYTNPLFYYRAEISELLKNRLDWANNKSPLINLPFSWHELGTWTQKPGYWKWREVLLREDAGNFFTNLMNRGYWLDDGKELTNPDLTFAHASSHIQIGSNAHFGYVAEEEIIEKREIIKQELMNADMTNADYSIQDYIGSQDANIWQQMGHRVHPENWGNGGRDCLGCLCGGGSHDNPNYSFERVYNFTSGGSLTLKTRGSGEQTCQIPAEGGKVTFWARGNSGGITLETEKITRETKIKKGETVIQEIDQERLENEVEVEELETLEKENEEEMNRELNSGGDRELEREPEKEPEKEQELEQETEQEQEQEKENETEKETEQEKEKEQEKEAEKEQEKEEEREEEEEFEEEEL